MRAFLFDPYRLGFMSRALVEILLLGTLGAVVGVHVALRRLAFVTEAVQLMVDKFASDHVPASHGHNYGDVYVDGWRSVSGDAGLSQDAIDRIQARIEAYAPTQPIGRYLE